MLLDSLAHSFVVKSFKASYQEILICKSIALSGMDINLFNDSQNTEALETVDLNQVSPKHVFPSSTPEASLSCIILNRLETFLKKQFDAAIRYGGDYASSYFKEALYIMVAYADEVFLTLNWGGRKEWEKNLLEMRMFNSHVAGKDIFTMLDKYLVERDPATRDLGTLYLWVLGLGFKGKFRRPDDEKDLAIYRKKLYKFIMAQNSNISSPKAKMFPETYRHTLIESQLIKLPSPHNYNIAFFSIVGIYILLSLSITVKETAPINEAINQILKYDYGTHIK